MAPEQQTHIPFMVWLSDSMQQKRQIDTQCLKNRSDQAYSHDNLIHSALGLMNVSAAAYRPEMDIFNQCRGSNMVEKRVPGVSVTPDSAG
jgi:lipid A ethanolaminephosphotransferase